MATFEAQRFVASHVRSIPRSGIRDFFDIVQGMKDVISLGVGEPDFVTPWHIREAAIYALEKGRTTYTSNLGLPRLRAVLAEHLAERFGVKYQPQTQILIAVGVSEAMDLALRALVNPGDEVIYHEPCYVSYSPSIVLAYGVPVAVSCRPEDGFSVTAEAIERAITPRSKVLILNFPTNPTGGTMTREELLKIAEVACRHNLVVLTDEIYSELTFEGEHVSIAALPGMEERTIFLHGFSKAYAMTGFRIGYACGPAELIEAMMKIHQYSMLCASIISQEAAIEAILHGRGDTERMREQYRLRRNVIVKALNDMGLSCHLPRGSFYAFPCIRSTGLSSKEFAVRLLQEEKVACVPGGAFGPTGEGFVRCCFATSLEQIEEAMRRMARFVERVRR
ncbi:aminotransferase class I/II-fold pyridoxal phosphate-dependent enzyme [Fontisphaera persica]|uniref:aminotransferase class I/II-fold pyridoxal phosphate-dependent enzyme n=1 Tax=Fontisphaera persica TaxID=2974023 RepID=UPI0024C0E074|nr:aminotransferase class I/II-fold pyridoxal phosphate-dependent enzyme [Fontisphaera persica]WCJ59499.1 aminotransferase class I/II-fold pyridoxal phosphate-dependent enzyme [Fontisphaera persica]